MFPAFPLTLFTRTVPYFPMSRLVSAGGFVLVLLRARQHQGGIQVSIVWPADAVAGPQRPRRPQRQR